MQHQDQGAIKKRGAYYTPKPISDFLVQWALENKSSSLNILEPSCGDGIFLRSLSESLCLKDKTTATILAVELNSKEAKKAKTELKNHENVTSKVVSSEYFGYMIRNSKRSKKKFDLVLGNPPFIKQSDFKQGREEAVRRISELGLTINQQSNAWVYFVIDAISRMSSNSRIGMVIPSDILQIDYAKEVHNWISANLDNTLIIGFDELVFPDIQQDVVLLLGEKSSKSQGKRLNLISVKNTTELTTKLWEEFTKSQPQNELNDNDWDLQYLSKSQIASIKRISSNSEFYSFGEVVDLRIGIVTGANDFFCITRSKLRELNIRRGNNKGLKVRKLIGSSITISGIEYTYLDHEKNHSNNQPTNLLDFNLDFDRSKLSQELQDYLELGESSKNNFHARNQLQRRDPWYSSEHVLTTQIGMYKRSHEYCKLILKPDDIFSTDTVYRIWILDNLSKKITPKQLVFSFVNSLTYLSCEMKGRGYGGGVLELVPKEIRSLKIPLYRCTDEEFSQLNKMFRDGDSIEKILDYTDDIILNFIDNSDKKTLRDCWRNLKLRRNNRSKRERV